MLSYVPLDQFPAPPFLLPSQDGKDKVDFVGFIQGVIEPLFDRTQYLFNRLVGSTTTSRNRARVVATTNQPLTGPATIDSLVLATGEIALMAAQSTGRENGPWVVNTNGAWTRPGDFATSAQATPGAQFFISEGTFAGTTWQLTTVDPIMLGVTGLTFKQMPQVAGKLRFATGDTPSIVVDDATSGTIGQPLSVKGQKAFAGKGGALNLGGGDPTSTNQAGDVVVDLGQFDGAGSSAKVSWLAASTEYLNANVAVSGAAMRLQSTTQLQFNASNNLIFTSTSGDLYFDARTLAGTPMARFRGTSSYENITFSFPTSGACSLAWGGASPTLTGLTYKINDQTVNSTNGVATTIKGQNSTGTTTVGGDVIADSGSGTTAHGKVRLRVNGTDRIVVDATGVGFFNVAAVAQQTRAGAITDNTGGAASTTFAAITAGAAYAQADMTAVKNALASIAAQYNKVDVILHNYGLST